MRPRYINGEFTQGEAAGAIEVANPATEEVMASVPHGTERDIEAAVAAGKNALTGWRKAANDRAEMLHEVAHKMREHEKHIIELLTREPAEAPTVACVGPIEKPRRCGCRGCANAGHFT